MTDFFIFRHGETYVSKHDLPSYGNKEFTTGILAEGKPAVERLGSYLKEIETDINLTSQYKRCLETVEIVSEVSGKKFKTDERLGEYRPEVEDVPRFLERMKNFVEDVGKSKYQSILICTHGYPISAITQYLSKNKIGIPELDNYPVPGVLTIVKDGEITEIDFNSKIPH